MGFTSRGDIGVKKSEFVTEINSFREKCQILCLSYFLIIYSIIIFFTDNSPTYNIVNTSQFYLEVDLIETNFICYCFFKGTVKEK